MSKKKQLILFVISYSDKFVDSVTSNLWVAGQKIGTGWSWTPGGTLPTLDWKTGFPSSEVNDTILFLDASDNFNLANQNQELVIPPLCMIPRKYSQSRLNVY